MVRRSGPGRRSADRGPRGANPGSQRGDTALRAAPAFFQGRHKVPLKYPLTRIECICKGDL